MMRRWVLSFVVWGILGASALAQEQRAIQPRMGDPLNGLTPAQLNRFEIGKTQFARIWTDVEGRGPVFNQNGCASCHSQPVIGGAGTIEVTRFGLPLKDGFDPLEELGGSLLQSQAISLQCAEMLPDNLPIVTANRVTPLSIGLGLIEAIDDEDIQAYAENPPPGIHGVVHYVQPLEGPPNTPRVGRFGWKAQVATVLTFSADASLNELGITNRLLMDENAPNGDEDLLAMCDAIPDPEDRPDPVNGEFIDHITDFQRFSAGPPQTPKSGMTGEDIFMDIRCGECHVPSFVTKNVNGLESALRNKPFQPYSDFLLHNMGQLGDGIVQGMGTEQLMRTPPLWGLRDRKAMIHDGRADSGEFAERVTNAIIEHNALFSEAVPSVIMFNALSLTEKQSLIRFLDSLGRAEFDQEGDRDIDVSDYAVIHGCLMSPDEDVYSADDLCAISDLDQDGDVDLLDAAGLQRAMTGPAQ